jgi:hypothetical protein
MRRTAAIMFFCAVFSAVLLAGPISGAKAQGGDYSGQAAVFADLGVYLPDSPDAQYAYGMPSDAKAGDLVFFDESGYGISHVGIATGYGTVIHASTYYGAVVETPIEYIPGYVGAVDAY